MNCTVLQRRLLTAERPDQPSADMLSHLEQCPACRAWQRRLVRMEQLIPLLPVPPSTTKMQLLERIQSASTGTDARAARAERPIVWHSSLAPGPKERGRRKLSLALTLAASLLVFALSWWAWPHNPPTPSENPVAVGDPFLRDFEGRLHGILQHKTPRDRVRKLADLADEVHVRAQKAVDNSDKLDRFAELYSRLVSLHLLEQARHLPPADRPAVLEDVASRLRQVESNASRKASQLKAAAPRSAASFDRIALTARKGEQELRAMMHS